MTLVKPHACLLAGDIGATKTSLAFYRAEDDLLQPYAETTFSNGDASGLEEIISNFLAGTEIHPDSACFGIAGPVIENRVRMTNLKWTIDARSLAERFGLQKVILINDLVATAMGAVQLPPDRLHEINKGTADPFGAVGVIAPGTGLGEAFLIRHGESWLPIPSEGGHGSFAPTDKQQRSLLHVMAQKHPHVSTEMVCSGIGIPNLYDFLCAESGSANAAHNHPDRTKFIVESALASLAADDQQNLALQTLRLFVSILASEAANLSLKVLATGGLYIGGGIPPRILPFLKPERFMPFFARGEYRDMLVALPIHVIMEPKTGLFGAAAYGREHLITMGNQP